MFFLKNAFKLFVNLPAYHPFTMLIGYEEYTVTVTDEFEFWNAYK